MIRALTSIRRVDVWFLACIVVAFVVYLLAGVLGAAARDVALYLYGGQRVLEGEPPYVAVRNRAGPVAQLLPSVGMVPGRLLGLSDDVVGPRVLYMLLGAITVGVVYLLGRRIFASRPAGLVAAAALLASEGFSYWAFFGPREKTPMVLLAALALLAALHRRWLLTGVLVSIATLTWQPVFVPLILAIAAMIAIDQPWRSWWRPVVRVAIGGAIPAGITLLCYAAIDRLELLLDWFWLINAKYTAQPSLIGSFDHAGPSLVRGYGWSLWLFGIGLAAALVAGILAARRRPEGSDERGRVRRMGLVAAAVYGPVGVVWSFRAFDGWSDALMLLPAASLGLAWLADLLVRRTPRRVGLAVTGAFTAVCVVTMGVHAVGERTTYLLDQRETVSTVVGAAPEDATLMTLVAPLPSVLTRERNPARIQLFSNGIAEFLEDDWTGGLDGYAQWLLDHDTTLVVTQGDQIDWFVPSLQEHYRSAGTTPGTITSAEDEWTWWVSRDVDDDSYDRVRDAVTSLQAE